MTSPACNRRGASFGGVRRAFTLLEIALVLTLIVVVAALSWPAFESWFQAQRLRDGIDNVRGLWVKARTLALQETRPYRFAWTATGYRLAPDCLEDWPDLGNSAFAPLPSGQGYMPGLVVEEALPPGVQFVGPEVNPQEPTWAPEMIVFWPDGTAKIVQADGMERAETFLPIGDATGRVSALHLRGLTGVVTVMTTWAP